MSESVAESKRLDNKFVVRCGVSRTLCVLQSKESYPYGTKVIAKTPRGQEVGEILCQATPTALKHLDNPPRGQIVRRFTDDDAHQESRIQRLAENEFHICEKFVSDLQLKMQLVDVEHLFGGERIVVYYLADARVDFRELVRRLAGEFKTRVEMRQIGVRDEAKLLADYGDCGKPVCCNTHLTKMPPVSMKMAKLQKASLDPTKISGRCGRLKCCLRFEYESYQSLRRSLPPIGSDVLTSEGRGRVLGHEILAQQLLIQTEDHRRILISVSEVLNVSQQADTGPAIPGGGKSHQRRQGRGSSTRPSAENSSTDKDQS